MAAKIFGYSENGESTDESGMTKPRFHTDDVLARLVAKAVQCGADELEIEYKDGNDEVFAVKGGVGFGIATLDSAAEEACVLRERLRTIGRTGKSINVGMKAVILKVTSFDSFGGTAYRVKIQEKLSR